MRKIDLLKELQDVDTGLDQARASLARIEEGLADNSELVLLAEQRDRLLGERKRLEAEQLDLELAVEDMRQKVKTLEDKLYGGRVRNPKELQDLSAEEEQLKRQISSKEDSLLEYYDRVEAVVKQASAAEKAYEDARRRWGERQEHLRAEKARLDVEVRTLEQRKEALRSQIDAATLRLYESLRRTRGGLAVAAIQQRTCQGCRISIPINVEMKARTSAEPILCQSCGRFLYAAI